VARPQAMGEEEAREFIGNADFDGPLVDFAAKGFSVDYAGEETLEGRPADKLMVMNRSGQLFFLWVDKQTAEVVLRTSPGRAGASAWPWKSSSN
jgi:hypothetical protein